MIQLSRMPRQQAGFTLVELLVSVVIGLALVAAILQTYLGGLRATRLTAVISQMNDDGQAALAIMTQHVRQSGLAIPDTATGLVPDLGLGGFTAFACSGTFASNSAAAGSLACVNGAVAGALAVAYQVDKYNSVVDSSGNPTDCTGAKITGTSPLVSQARFYVKNEKLLCTGSGGTTPFSNSQTVVEGVEALVMRLGVASPTAGTGQMVAVGYMNPSEVGPLAGTVGVYPDAGFQALSGIERWNRVVTVRLCLLMVSADPVLESSGSTQQYLDCDDVVQTSNDRRFRKAYATTVALRNRGM